MFASNVVHNIYEDNKKDSIVLALGFFDSIHLGHLMIINKAIELSTKYKATPALFTFNDSNDDFFKKGRKGLFSFEERLRRYKNVGINYIVSATPTKEFLSYDGESFLNLLTKNYTIKAIVTGSDYRFGSMASSDVNDLKEYAKKHNIEYIMFDLLHDELNKKYATREIESLLQQGKIEQINKIISEPYSCSGVVIEDRHVGSKFGYPTANINIDFNLTTIGDGVYATYCIIDNQRYLSITNVGSRPTFDNKTVKIETHILDFSKTIYNKEIRVEFVKKIREVKKFSLFDDLYSQIEKDIEYRRSLV